ncbi:MAG TPA: CDP-alcohol phosphatidyltransferase family protein [Mycobacteriales bacterium]|nr:CDP-alcohol phosphatidyltransferase family protein [Mycobacteriales bacterium]
MTVSEEEVRSGSPVTAPQPDRIFTIPNLISFLRLLGVPLFLWLVLGPRADGYALVVLMASGVSDYLDGKIARMFGMTSRLGELLDPLADRLYIASTLIALTVRGIVPLWLLIVLVSRDAVLALCLPILHRHGYGPLPVHFLGKAATFNLLYAFPFLLFSVGHGTVSTITRPLGWAFALWGTGMYWWAGALYIAQVRQLVVADSAGGLE